MMVKTLTMTQAVILGVKVCIIHLFVSVKTKNLTQQNREVSMIGYVILALAVMVAIGWGLIYMIGANIGDCCSGDCNQGRTCDCKDETSGN